MPHEYQDRAAEILRESATKPEADRYSYAVELCGEDGELRDMVETMLAAPSLVPPPADSDQTAIIDTSALADKVVSTPAGAAAAAATTAKPATHGKRISTGGASTLRRKVDSGDLAGQQLGPYELVRRIGKGGMGTVYSARRVDQEFRKLVAIKFIKPGMETDEIIMRFKQERQVLAGLDHPNIGRLLDGGSDHGVPYLVMEYVEGTPIDEFVKTRRLSVTERLNLFITVCSAVQYAHQSLVVHRDIKPSNILVSAEGVPKLLDFGIAKVLTPEYADAGMTNATERPMTPDFASPEQVRGEPVTTSSDVYALGVLLFELLTTTHPLRKEYKKLGFERAVLECEPTPPSVAVSELEKDGPDVPEGSRERLRNKLRGDLDAIVLMALRKEPQRRYASVQHFVDDIHRYLEGAPVRAQKDTVGYRVDKFVRRHAGGVLAATLAIVALIASSIISWTYYRQATIERRRAEQRFSDVRQLANFVLFDFDKIIQQGTTPARKALIEKATEYLDRLEKDRSADPSLERELVEGYLKVGDLQGNMFAANLGDRAAAKRSYDRALKVIDSARASDPLAMAQARLRIGDLLNQSGSVRDAAEAYRKSKETLEQYAKANPQARRDLLDATSKLANAETALGDMPKAIALFEELRAAARDMDEANPGNLEFRRMYGLAELRAGYLRAKLGEATGLPQMDRALRIFDEMAANAPNSAVPQRALVTAHGLIGEVLADRKQWKQSADSYRRALEIVEKLSISDPRNEFFKRDLTTFASRLANSTANAGNISEARELTKRALASLRPLVAKDDALAHDLYEYAWILLTTRVPDLRDGRTAQRYAEQLVEMSKGQEPGALDVLARSYAATGDFARAADTERRALSILSPESSVVRTELESNLADFRAGREPGGK